MKLAIEIAEHFAKAAVAMLIAIGIVSAVSVPVWAVFSWYYGIN